MVYLLYGTAYLCRKDGEYFLTESHHNLLQEAIPENAVKVSKDSYYSWVTYFCDEFKDINPHLFHYKFAE